MKHNFSAVLIYALSFFCHAAELASGPMLGHVSAREAAIWFQSDQPAAATLAYWSLNSPDERHHSAVVQTNLEHANTGTLLATNLMPGTAYGFEILLGNQPQTAKHRQTFTTQTLWRWRDDPPDFRFALGSCSYINEAAFDRPGRPYGGDYQIFDAIADKQPDFMLWLGDNVYYRDTDWEAPSSMYARFSHTRRLPELQRLLSTAHHYAIWDDHDYGPDNSDRSFFLREQAVQVFNDFWANPITNVTGAGGITSFLEWHDVAFFMLDNRYFRQANHRVSGQRTILGKKQLEWLINGLKSSTASFKFIAIGGQFISSSEVFENYVMMAPGERRLLLDLVAAEQIPGVVFLSGDRHHASLHKMTRQNSYPLYDWTVSPLTASTHNPLPGEGQYRVADSVYTERNFGIAEVSGPFNDRTLTLTLHDVDGEPVWSTEIKQTELQ